MGEAVQAVQLTDGNFQREWPDFVQRHVDPYRDRAAALEAALVAAGGQDRIRTAPQHGAGKATGL